MTPYVIYGVSFADVDCDRRFDAVLAATLEFLATHSDPKDCGVRSISRSRGQSCSFDSRLAASSSTPWPDLGLSARGYDRVLKVARTIADLGASERLDSSHVAEAVHYRALDRAYFRAG
jgi:hypothetical protein